ncbi:hypothetical protein AX15_006844 [Amanita polypyramis BW_CC]|nr:hypothetical protein AX15_006844 [Amanita polypyramis BW_CC]
MLAESVGLERCKSGVPIGDAPTFSGPHLKPSTMHDEGSPSLLMSQIIAADAPLLSPVSAPDSAWDSNSPLYTDSFNYNFYYPSPTSSADSPSPAPRMLKSRMSPESSVEPELCLPTHQVFSFPQLSHAPLPPSPSPSEVSQHHVTVSMDDRPCSSSSASSSPAYHLHATQSPPTKRTSTLPAIVTKKPRSGERISTKDFIPPDVTGLSKREARLVKNRAAAFLSRQRKREEFEYMENRVAELEQENARLLTLAQNGNSYSHPKQHGGELASEVEQLRAQLAAAKDRERELSAKLAKSASSDSSIKAEAVDNQLSLSSPARVASNTSNIPSPHRSGASLGLMVLLCALPTLLSMPVQSNTPASFSVPDPLPTSSLDYNSYLPSEYDWARTNGQSVMDLDKDEQRRINAASTPIPITRKLEFTDVDNPALAGLGGLDVSFDALPSADGKIRVRIHQSSSSPSSSDVSSRSNNAHPDTWSGFQGSPANLNVFPSSSYSISSSKDDPFFGIGMPNGYGTLSPIVSPLSSYQYNQLSSSFMEYGQLPDSTFAYGSQFTLPDSPAFGTRRVRIALKSLPASGGEGGEWEVQIC